MKIHVAGLGGDITAVRDHVRRLDEIGIDGVFAGDHLFFSFGRPRADAQRGGDPFARLATVGVLSDRLMIGTSVVNVGFMHPALALRQFLQLADLFGGERVLAGIGAGWNGEEFAAIGMEFPPFAERMDRLEEACRLAGMVFEDGFANLDGKHVVARELPLGPRPKTSPRLFLGGGSDRLLDIAGRYADVVDLNGSSRRLRLSGPQPIKKDAVRRLTTTVADLESSVKRIRVSANAAGRDPARIEMSIIVHSLKFCRDSEVPDLEASECRSAGVDPMPLGECPYVLIGSPERLRENLAEHKERIGLEHVILSPFPYEDIARFRSEVAA